MLLKEYFMLNLIKNQNKFSFLKKHSTGWQVTQLN